MRMLVYASRYTRVEDLIAYVWWLGQYEMDPSKIGQS